MTLTDEQARQIKEHLLDQLSNFSQDKKEQISQQVNTMTPNQVEDFVKQNQLTHLERSPCIFCSIISGKTPSLRIAENENNIAILEINPLSKGHTLIVPREHSIKREDSVQEIVKEIKKKLRKKFNPKKIESKETKIMGHTIIEIVPTYEENGAQQERKQATEEELRALQEEILKDTTKITNLNESKTKENILSQENSSKDFLSKEPKPEDPAPEPQEKLFKMRPRIPN